jgi:acyl phosphate:glycerol-3-phosphate acyltransferase
MTALAVGLIAAGWVAGSMPWGYWLVRVFRHDDIRTKGSGNIGATNVWRVYGRRLGVPVILLDTAKGFVPALVATKLVGHWAGVLAGGAAMAGHYRPLFLRFSKGGKIVATTGGAFLGVAPIVGGIGAGVWIVVFLAFRYASLASIVGAATLPFWAWLLGYPWPVAAFGAIGALGVVLLHKANIRRLVHGNEHRAQLRRRNKPPLDASAEA